MNTEHEQNPGFHHAMLEYVSRPPGYKRLLHPVGNLRHGENLLSLDWDLCIVLDACRVDLFRSVFEDQWTPPHPAEWDTLFSVDSATAPWIEKTFSRGGTEDLTYVSANPHSADLQHQHSSRLGRVDDVWRYGWNDELGTVPPDIVTDRAISQYRRHGERVMVHYIQPHVPFLTETEGELQRRFEPPGEHTTEENAGILREVISTIKPVLPGEWCSPGPASPSVFDRLRCGAVSYQDVWEGYRETLSIVLESVTTLLRSVDADTVVITADHGNALGEWGLYGHPRHMPFSVLREVPYLTTRATAELGYDPSERVGSTGDERQNVDAFADRLRALGYR